MTEEKNIVFSTYPPESFQCLFWQQQKEARIKADKQGMKWHPAMIKYSVSILDTNHKRHMKP